MNMLIVVNDNIEIAPLSPISEFEWRDRHGKFHLPKNMKTTHLFHVIRMIWDHAMPPEAQTHFPKRYNFSEFYTIDYMACAVKFGLHELFNRSDLEPYMIYWLDQMAWYLRNKKQIDFVRKVNFAQGG